MKRLVYVIILSCILSSCVPKHRTATVQDNRLRLYKARCADIPIPIHAVPQFVSDVGAERSDQSYVLEYTTVVSTNEIMVFYKQHMERLGWHLQGEYNDETHESLLQFIKPLRWCTISIRSQHMRTKQQTLLVIMCGKIKRADYD